MCKGLPAHGVAMAKQSRKRETEEPPRPTCSHGRGKPKNLIGGKCWSEANPMEARVKLPLETDLARALSSQDTAWRSVACLVCFRTDRGDPNENVWRCRRLLVGSHCGAEPVQTVARRHSDWSPSACCTRGSRARRSVIDFGGDRNLPEEGRILTFLIWRGL